MSKFTRRMSFFRTKKRIAIDLGTSNVLIYDKKKIVLNEPSIVVKNKRDGEIIAIGNRAKKMLGKTPENIEVIKPINEGVVSDINALRAMLKYFLNKLYVFSFFKPEIIISIPAETTKIEKKAILEAIPKAKKVYLIEGPRAGLVGSGIDISEPKGNLIVDIGGGSTDISILSLNETVVSKTVKIGGNKFDDDIINFMKKQYGLLIGERTAEIIKKEIGTAKNLPYEENLLADVRGRDLESGMPKVIEISTNHVYEATKSSVDEIVLAIREVLKKCPPELSPDVLDSGILLTGGGSLIKNLDLAIQEELNIKVKRGDNPLEAIVIGSALAFKNKKLLKTLITTEN